MAPLSIQIYVVGPVQTNCYFAINDDTKEVLIIDPGASAKQLAEKVKEQGLKPVAILLMKVLPCRSPTLSMLLCIIYDYILFSIKNQRLNFASGFHHHSI